MKSMFFKNLAKGFVVAGAVMALVNCDNSTAANGDNQNTDQPVATLPADTASTGVPQNGANVPPTGNPINGEIIFNGDNSGSENGSGVVADSTQPAVNPGQDSNTTEIGGGNSNQTGIPDDVLCLSSSLPGACQNDTLTKPTDPSSSASGDVVDPASSSSEAVCSSSEETVVESSSSEEAKVEGGIFLAEDTDENQDYMEVEYIKNTGWDGGGILAYPKRLSDTKKHAVVMWGPGGGTDPDAYGGMIRRLASHGFVVIALKESPGNTNQGKPALDWLEKKGNTPGDPLFGKLDMTKVGCSGHSMGGLESEQMLINDSRVITAIMNNSGDLGHTAMASVPASKTIAIVYGEGGMERPNAEADYNNQGVRAPACLLKMTGGTGNECQQGECGYGHGSGAWDGVPATVAWMRWHLGGEDFRKADFVGSTGKYIDGPIYVGNGFGGLKQQGKWKGQCKNF